MRSLRRPTKFTLAAIFTFLAVSFFVTQGPAAVPVKQPVNDTAGVAIHGYDPVAYFTEHEAVRGDANIRFVFDGIIYQFSSEENLELFRADPLAYLPEFGGFSVFGIAKGKTYDTDPTAFDIIDGRLYLSRNEKVRGLWQSNPEGYISSASRNWCELQLN